MFQIFYTSIKTSKIIFKIFRHAKECEQEFICQLCGKQLSSSAKLRAHALTHSDDRPFKANCDF